MIPTATALVHDLSAQELGGGGGEDENTRQVHSASLSSRMQKAPTFLPGFRKFCVIYRGLFQSGQPAKITTYYSHFAGCS